MENKNKVKQLRQGQKVAFMATLATLLVAIMRAVIGYVLEGTGVVEIGEENKEVGQDTLIGSPAKIPHCWYDNSDKVLRVLVVKVPRPTESARLL